MQPSQIAASVPRTNSVVAMGIVMKGFELVRAVIPIEVPPLDNPVFLATAVAVFALFVEWHVSLNATNCAIHCDGQSRIKRLQFAHQSLSLLSMTLRAMLSFKCGEEKPLRLY